MSAARNDASLRDFDLIVIGGGSGGLAATFRASEHGARVALLAAGPLGGTCVNVGCVPKKAMWLAAELATRVRHAQALGFGVPAPTLDWPEFIVHRERYIANIHASYNKRLDAAGIVVMPQRGWFTAPDCVTTDNDVCLRAPQVLVATGGRPQRPDIPGAELGIDSDGFFQLCAAPERVAVIGGGYIAVELAGVLQALGSRVEMFVRGPQLLRGFDDDITAQLAQDYRQDGIHLHFGHQLRALRDAGAGRVVLRDGDGNDSNTFDSVIFATGRTPNSNDLGLAAAGVEIDARGFVVVDAFQRTNVAGIHAVGDITGQMALTPVAIAASRRLMDRLFGGQPESKLDHDNIPSVVFSHPPLGMVGMTEAQARRVHGDVVRTYRAGFRPMLNALADVPQRSLFKLVCVGEGGAGQQRVVGLHLLGEAADEILQGFAVGLKLGMTLRDLQDTVAIHPTSAEEVVLMR